MGGTFGKAETLFNNMLPEDTIECVYCGWAILKGLGERNLLL